MKMLLSFQRRKINSERAGQRVIELSVVGYWTIMYFIDVL